MALQLSALAALAEDQVLFPEPTWKLTNHREKPQKWRVEISSSQKKVKTVWQLSDSSPIDHSSFHKPDFSELTLNGSLEERTAFINMVTCSQVHFNTNQKRWGEETGNFQILKYRHQVNFEAEKKHDPEGCLKDEGGDEILSQPWLLRRSVSSRAAMRMERTQTVGTTISEATRMCLSKGSETDREHSTRSELCFEAKLKKRYHCGVFCIVFV
ncbi:putative protein zwilch like protein [Cricetulus griseus]|uniref:Protein zwilch n=2 Tax=Cricetulus griseus TaxID=10029 RepID=A0A061I2I7_CRIGR|nr:putative protein zwilch like protein [Cricetulus griseus]